MNTMQLLALAGMLLSLPSCRRAPPVETQLMERTSSNENARRKSEAAAQDEALRCPDASADKRAFFGDLHVHTSYSFDAYAVRNTRNDPVQAYKFARGEEVWLPPFDSEGKGVRRIKLDRPLDFAAVTDHSEFIGETALCTDPDHPLYASPACANFRNMGPLERHLLHGDLAFMLWGLRLTRPHPVRLPLCARPGVDCLKSAQTAWHRIQQATEDAYDPCTFTSLHAYEWTGTVSGAMNHRNVIFRSALVPDQPISYFEAQNWQDLALGLREQCAALGDGCDVLAIPHNPNLSRGNLFAPIDREGKPYTAETAKLRAEMEPLVEVVQVKQESECRNGFSTYPAAIDELCDFEKVTPNIPICKKGERQCGRFEKPEKDECGICIKECAPGESGDCVAPYDYVRNTLKLGLQEEARVGVNPYHLGFIGSTDTHNGTPGATDEAAFESAHGLADTDIRDVLNDESTPAFTNQATPGGLAGVWAEQNTRSAIFDALKRREVFGTSGSRIRVRFFGGWDLPLEMCESASFAAEGYAKGVPMGGDLPAATGKAGAPIFAVQALRDVKSARLQRIQIIKVWVDASGENHEEVFDITPDPDYSATVDLATCTPQGPGRDALCATWRDPAFDPQAHAAYYARVIENPTCRWTTYKCNDLQVDCSDADAPRACCDGSIPKTIQERAWSSPIFYQP